MIKTIKKLPIILLLVSYLGNINAQDFEVPESAFDNLVKMEYDINDSVVQEFYVEYPKGYDKELSYPVFLGLAGGNQSVKTVRYCYAVYFKTSLLDDYIKVFPVSPSEKGLRSYDEKYYSLFLSEIRNRLSCSAADWIVAGTSNGGIAAFELVSFYPKLFKGILTMPGVLSGDKIEVNKSWNHLKVLLAYGEKDSDHWTKGALETQEILKEYGVESKTMILEGQEHILRLDFNIDLVYSRFFKMF